MDKKHEPGGLQVGKSFEAGLSTGRAMFFARRGQSWHNRENDPGISALSVSQFRNPENLKNLVLLGVFDFLDHKTIGADFSTSLAVHQKKLTQALLFFPWTLDG
jgi:hypothetical protein